MEELEKLYEVLKRDGYYTKTYDDFKTQWGDQSYQDKVYGVVTRDNLYTKSKEEFLQKYSAPATQAAPIPEKKSPDVSSQGSGIPLPPVSQGFAVPSPQPQQPLEQRGQNDTNAAPQQQPSKVTRMLSPRGEVYEFTDEQVRNALDVQSKRLFGVDYRSASQQQREAAEKVVSDAHAGWEDVTNASEQYMNIKTASPYDAAKGISVGASEATSTFLGTLRDAATYPNTATMDFFKPVAAQYGDVFRKETGADLDAAIGIWQDKAAKSMQERINTQEDLEDIQASPLKRLLGFSLGTATDEGVILGKDDVRGDAQRYMSLTEEGVRRLVAPNTVIGRTGASAVFEDMRKEAKASFDARLADLDRQAKEAGDKGDREAANAAQKRADAYRTGSEAKFIEGLDRVIERAKADEAAHYAEGGPEQWVHENIRMPMAKAAGIDIGEKSPMFTQDEARREFHEDIKAGKYNDRPREMSAMALLYGMPLGEQMQKSRWATYGSGGGSMTALLGVEAIGSGVLRLPPGLLSSEVGGLSMAQSAYDDAIQKGATPDQAARTSIDNYFIGLSEGVPIGGWVGRIDKAFGGKGRAALVTALKGGKFGRAGATAAIAAGSMATQGAEEALQEYLSQVASNASAREIYDASRSLTEGAMEGAEAGFVLGALMGIGEIKVARSGLDAQILSEAKALLRDKGIEYAKEQLANERNPVVRVALQERIAELEAAAPAPTQQAATPKPEADATKVTAEPEVTSVTTETAVPEVTAETPPPTTPAEEIVSTEISTPTTEEVTVEQEPVVPSQRTAAPPESAPFSLQEQRLIDEAMASISAPRESADTETEVAAIEESVAPEVQPIEQPAAESPITLTAPPPALKPRVAAPPKSADAKKIQQHFPSTPREAAMKYFLEGGKVSEADALRYSPTGISEELKGTGYISKAQRSGLDKIAEQIQEQYPHLDEQEVTQAIGELIGTSLQDMRTEILEPYRRLESAEQQLRGAETELTAEEIVMPDEGVERPSDVPFQEGAPSGVPISRRQIEASVRMLGAMADTWAKVMGRSREDLLKRISISPDKKTFLIADERGVKGAYRKMADAHVVGLFAEADPSTPIHEFAHIGESLLREMAEADPNWKRKLSAVESWAGARNGKWTKAAREKFARAFENYARTNILPEGAPAALRKAFDVIRDFMHKVYTAVKGSGIDVRISPEVRAVFDEMLGLEAGSTTRGKQAQQSVAEFETTGRVAEEFDSIPAGNLTARKKFDNKIAKNAYADLRDITRNFERIMESISDKISQACP